jgi:hypothetical protein
MKSLISYILVILLLSAFIWLLVERHSHVQIVRSNIEQQYMTVIDHVGKEIAGPDGVINDAKRQAFITYLVPTAVVKPGQAVIIKAHFVNNKPDPSYLFEVYAGDTMIGTFDRQIIEGYFYGRGQIHDIDLDASS